MGDVRFLNVLRVVKDAPDRAAVISGLSDEDVVAALAATAMTGDKYLANVLASEAMNRARQKETIFHHAGEGLCIVDAQGRIRRINATGADMLGWEPDALIGTPFHETIHRIDEHGTQGPQERCPVHATSLGKGQLAHEEDEFFARQDGSVFPAAYSAAPIRLDDEIRGAVIIFRDISRQRRAKAYRAAGHALTAILASAASLDEAAPRVLRTIGEAFGWQTGVLWLPENGNGPLACAHFWKQEGIEAPVFEAATRGVRFSLGEGFPGKVWSQAKPVWVTDFRTVDPAGFPRALPAAEDGFKALFGFPCEAVGRVMGVIEFASLDARQPGAQLLERAESFGAQMGHFIAHERTQRALRESEARKTGLVRASLDAIVAIDAAGIIIEWNPAAERILGWATNEAIGRELASLIIPERYRDAHRRGMKHFLATGEGPILGKRLSLPALRRDGTEFASELSIVPVDAGDTVFFTGFLRDVSGEAPTGSPEPAASSG